MSWLEGSRARLRLLFSPRGAESRMDHEFQFHLQMETERLMREEGLDEAEARRRARVAFGGVENHKETLREGRGLAWLGGLTLDLKLGGRMLVKYPGLTVVGGFAMAFAIWVGAVVFEMAMLFVSPSLPLPQGDRVVYLRTWDVQAIDEEPRVLHDFIVWRQAMRMVSDLGAWQDVVRNLKGRDGETRPVGIAAMTAAGFRVAATPALLGRFLMPDDERAGAPPVVVLGHETWRTRFGGDSGIVGQSVQLDDAHATVVGVMPEGFKFPIAHDAWMPFRPNLAEAAPRTGPAITVFGRLAEGATLDDAQAELSALGMRAAQQSPETHRHLQPQVRPYTDVTVIGGTDDFAILGLMQVFTLMLLVLVCSNVALLLFARAATREAEIIVRSALGASRRRIVMQLFAEALVLGGVAAAFGLLAAHVALRQVGLPFLEANLDRVAFWIDPHLSPRTVLYAGALTLLAAAIAGGLPGLKVTRGIGSRLRAGVAGSGGLRFGGVWTAVIVAQVAVTVAFPAVALLEFREIQRVKSYDVGFAADEYLAVQLSLEADPGDEVDRDRFGAIVETLRRRLAAEPGIAGVTFADRLPRTNYSYDRILLDDSASVIASAAGRKLRRYSKIAFVDPSYFDVLEAPVLAGRGFQSADLAPGVHTAIVDQGFVDQILLGQNPIGRRVRIAGDWPLTPAQADSLPWFEIVGVVKDLGMNGAGETTRPLGIYRAAAPGSGFAPQMLLHTLGDPMEFVTRVRAIAATVDPALRLADFQRMDQVTSDLLWIGAMWLRMTLVMTAVALVLSLAGIYSVLAFAVARRTNEIGVRVALGASRRGVLVAIFRKPLTQVSIGIVVGAALIALGTVGLSHTYQFQDWPKTLSAGQIGLLALYAVFMLGVCLLACVVPTRRALAVEPVVAMRVE